MVQSIIAYTELKPDIWRPIAQPVQTLIFVSMHRVSDCSIALQKYVEKNLLGSHATDSELKRI